jgi:CHASE2 domain-containing sensor protein
MKPVTTRNSKRPASPMRILLIWTLVSGLLFGVAEFGEPLDDIFRIARNKMREHNASGQVVVVGIDDLAQQEIGDWPWKADRYARMVDNLNAAGANRIFFDFTIKGLANDPGARRLVEALKKHDGKVYLSAAFSEDGATGKRGTDDTTAGREAVLASCEFQCLDQRL